MLHPPVPLSLNLWMVFLLCPWLVYYIPPPASSLFYIVVSYLLPAFPAVIARSFAYQLWWPSSLLCLPQCSTCALALSALVRLLLLPNPLFYPDLGTTGSNHRRALNGVRYRMQKVTIIVRVGHLVLCGLCVFVYRTKRIRMSTFSYGPIVLFQYFCTRICLCFIFEGYCILNFG